MISRLIEKYFDSFNAHSMESLATLFTNDIQLQDWDVELDGIDAVMRFYQQLFDEAPEIQVSTKRLVIEGTVACCELLVTTGTGNKFAVMDVIDVRGNKISMISAFRRF